ncbi:MAG: WYL domain-containing protein [Deltaproteobacteria bacterium]
MSRGKSIATIVKIIEAFSDQRTWKQADLRRHVSVSMDTLRATLDALSEGGWAFEREHEHPHVYWSLPQDAFGGGVVLRREDTITSLRLLRRLRPGDARDRLIDKLVRCVPSTSHDLVENVLHPVSESEQEGVREAIEDAMDRGEAIDVRYYSSHRGDLAWRTLSVLRVVQGPAVRVVAVCHRTDALRWFRMDRIAMYREASEAFRPRDGDIVEAFLAASVDGFHDGSEPTEVAFFVRAPEANWVGSNLPPPLVATRVEGGILVEGRVAGLFGVARFVVGLGEAAEVRTPALAELVADIAAGALANANRAFDR